MLLADFGTSYCKIFDTEADAQPRIVANRALPVPATGFSITCGVLEIGRPPCRDRL